MNEDSSHKCMKSHLIHHKWRLPYVHAWMRDARAMRRNNIYVILDAKIAYFQFQITIPFYLGLDQPERIQNVFFVRFMKKIINVCLHFFFFWIHFCYFSSREKYTQYNSFFVCLLINFSLSESSIWFLRKHIWYFYFVVWPPLLSQQFQWILLIFVVYCGNRLPIHFWALPFFRCCYSRTSFVPFSV